jgi:hypothetical protein
VQLHKVKHLRHKSTFYFCAEFKIIIKSIAQVLDLFLHVGHTVLLYKQWGNSGTRSAQSWTTYTYTCITFLLFYCAAAKIGQHIRIKSEQAWKYQTNEHKCINLVGLKRNITTQFKNLKLYFSRHNIVKRKNALYMTTKV